MGLFDLFSKKEKVDISNEYLNLLSAKASPEYKNIEWVIPFIVSVANNKDWDSEIYDKQRVESIQEGIIENKKSEQIWQEKIKLIKPDYGAFMYGSKSDFPVNRRCICFECRDYNNERYIRICIDLLSGTPYLSDEQVTYYGAAMGVTYKQKRITWDVFLSIAKIISDEVLNYYSGINDKNWRNYLKANMVEFCLD